MTMIPAKTPAPSWQPSGPISQVGLAAGLAAGLGAVSFLLFRRFSRTSRLFYGLQRADEDPDLARLVKATRRALMWSMRGDNASSAKLMGLVAALQPPSSAAAPLFMQSMFLSTSPGPAAQQVLERARQQARIMPTDLNRIFDPDYDTLADVDEGASERFTIEELVPGVLWVVTTGFRTRPDSFVLSIQSAILRLRTGRIVVVNPGVFPDAAAEQINKLGTVHTVIETANAHSYGITRSAEIWPDAALVGSDAKKLHNRPNLAWARFLEDGDALFDGELEVIRLNGHGFGETLLFNRANRLLLGAADMFILSGINSSQAGRKPVPALGMYAIALGMARLEPHASVVTPQAYHVCLIDDPDALAAACNRAAALEIDIMPLAHGGILRGKTANDVLRSTYECALQAPRGFMRGLVAAAFTLDLLVEHLLPWWWL